jgi:hypothetical protein
LIAFWQIYMAICAVLIFNGRRNGKWIGPALVLAGLVGTRAVVEYAAPMLHDVASCALWLSVAGVMTINRLWLPSVLCATSGMVYPAAMLAGMRVEYLGAVPIVADVMMVLGLFASLASGGGNGVAVDTRRGSRRVRVLVAHREEGVAPYKAGGS